MALKVEHLRILFDYNYWTRDRLLAAMGNMPESEYSNENGFSYGSIRGILTHCLETEFGWRSRFEGRARTTPIKEADVATVALLTERWRNEEAMMRGYFHF